MFDRFIRLARARKALQEHRFEDALQLADDPVIRAGRRAEEVRSRARDLLLKRARQRFGAGDLRAARAVFQRLSAAANNEEVRALGLELDAGEARAREVTDVARKGIDEARKLMAQGQVADATAAVAAISDEGPTVGGLSAERQQLKQQLDDRKKRASEQLKAATEHLRHKRIAEARQAFERASALDRDAAAGAAIRPRLMDAWAQQVGARILTRLGANDLPGAFAELRTLRAQADLIDELGPLRKPLAKLQAATLATLRATDDVQAAAALASAAENTGLALAEPAAGLVMAIQRFSAAKGTAGSAVALELQTAAERAGAKKLAAMARKLTNRQNDIAAKLTAARLLMAEGDLDSARQQLTEVLAEEPMHEAARSDVDLVEQGIQGLAQRLEEARSAAKAGNLRAACAAALALGTTGRIGAEAQLLLTDVRARMALVDRGLDEIRTTLHGRAAGSVQGVRHCLGRLEELGKVQVDHEELERAIVAVSAEVEGLEACDRTAAALDRSAAAAAATAFKEVLGVRERLLAPERLDARALTLADRFQRLGERALAGGLGRDLEACAGTLEALGVVAPEFATMAGRLRNEALKRTVAAEERAAEAAQSLARRDLAEAERLLEEAQELWADSPQVRALASKLQGFRKQTSAIEEVAELARGRDYRGAAEKVAAMPPTPALLRTRIFDMKQQLARAQGLEGAFLMRVDEGGEHLVLRGESVSIGNVRQSCADLPVLANIAGKHATIQRSMSFHGGMEDRVLAEDGEVRVGGRRVKSHRLTPGDRIELGPSLAAVYQRPTSRSLTVGLVLQGGFQVAGTDRILLMKDRGKDGRILLGPSRDVHVRVGSATGEVEVFAASTGQIRVACPAGGTIDGNPFKGEHPVDAGQVVTAAGVTFVLLPWRPA